MPSWPSDVPAYFLESGFSEEFVPNLLITPMEGGGFKSRRRFSQDVRIIQGAIEMSAAQWATFETFYLSTLKNGAVAFDWVHPTLRTSRTFRFLSEPRPQVFGSDNRRVAMRLEMRA